VAAPGQRGRAERGRHRHKCDLIEQQQPAAVRPVRQRPAEQRHRDERPELDRAEQTGEQRRPRLDVDLVGQRDERRLRAEPGDEVAQDEPAQLA
jgi:hypothetical protein